MSALVANLSRFDECTDMIRTGSSFSRSTSFGFFPDFVIASGGLPVRLRIDEALHQFS